MIKKITHISTTILFLLLIVLPLPSFAHNNVVVIPLGNDRVGNVITVAKQGGDFADPIAALASITDSSPTNPYLVVIGPGVYELADRLELKPNVNLVGSGQNATKLIRTNNVVNNTSNGTVILGSFNASVSELTVENTSPSGSNGGIVNTGAFFEIRNVTILMNGASTSTGIFNTGTSVIISGVTIISSNDNSSITGIRLGFGFSNSPEIIASTNITDTRIQLSGDANFRTGIANDSNATTISNVRIAINGDGNFYNGISNANGRLITVRNSEIVVVTTGTNSRGIFNQTNTNSARIYNSLISAEGISSTAVDAGIGFNQNETYIVNSIIGDGTIDGNPICVSTFLESGSELDQGCD